MLQGSEILTTGLTQGYTGNTQTNTAERHLFLLKSSIYYGEDGDYVDQWLNASTGGGQELARSLDGRMWTRLYAGGVIAAESLSDLGTSEDKVIEYLIKKINEIGSATRLDADCLPEADGDWRYAYKITDNIPEAQLIRALETVHYKGALVFIHGFMICQVTNYTQ